MKHNPAPSIPEAVKPSADPRRLAEDRVATKVEPLLDCLFEVIRLQGVATSRDALTAGLPVEPDGGLNLRNLTRAASRAGMAASIKKVTLGEISDRALPVILMLKDKGACVLAGWEDDLGVKKAKVIFPESGQGVTKLTAEELAALHIGVTIFVRPRFQFDSRAQEVRPTRGGHWFWGVVLGQRFIYREVLWAALAVNILALVFPIFSMNVYDRVIPNRAEETLWVLAGGVLFTQILDLVMRKMRSRFVDEASARIDVRLSSSIMERVLGMRLEHRPQSVGSFASNLRGFESVRDFIASSTVTALIDLPFALVFLVAIAWISPILALPVFGAFILIMVGGYLMQHRLHELSETTHQASAQRNATLVESLIGIEAIKAATAEGVIQGKWERVNQFIAETNIKMRGLSSGASYGTQWMSNLVSLLTIVIGFYLIADKSITQGALVACSTLVSRALAPAGQVVALLMQYQGARTSLEALDKVMAKPVERDGSTSYLHRPAIHGEVEFRDVGFSYPDGTPAIKGLNMRIRAGERVAILGRVGSGKTTMQKLVLGLYQPTEGAILLDGVDIRQLDPADLRRNVAYVSQDVSLLSGSLRYNITLARPQADDLSISHAAGMAGLMDMVSRHPKGFDLQVGERGDLLSGGQRQAVGLARAFLQDAPVLVLDEPTSAMDMASEAAVAASLSRECAGRTLILSTHRLHLLTLVDRVIVVDRGRIIADGPRDQIMQGMSNANAMGSPGAAQGRPAVMVQPRQPAQGPSFGMNTNVKKA